MTWFLLLFFGDPHCLISPSVSLPLSALTLACGVVYVTAEHEMNDVHCALQASGQCIGTSLAGLPTCLLLGYGRSVGIWSRDLLQSILHFLVISFK